MTVFIAVKISYSGEQSNSQDAAFMLESFLFKFIAAPVVVAVIIPVVVPVIAAVVVALLKFLVAFVPVVAITAAVSFPFPVFVGAEALDIRCIGEFQLTIGQGGKFSLDRVIVDGFLVPVVIRQLHVIGDGIGKTIALVRVLFGQRFIDNDLEILAHVGEFRITFGVSHRVGPGSQRFAGGYRIR